MNHCPPPQARTVSDSGEANEQSPPGVGVIWVSDYFRYTPLPDGRVTLGRAERCDVSLGESRVARTHATLEVAGRRIVLLPGAARQGVYRNGVRVLSGPLELQDVLRLGNAVGVLTVEPSSKSLDTKQPGMVLGATSQRILASATLATRAGLPLGLVGQAGTGKSSFAACAHRLSRQRGDFLVLDGRQPSREHQSWLMNCGSSELSTSAPGATLFLKYVDQLPAELQPKLARCLATAKALRFMFSSEVSLLKQRAPAHLSPELLASLAPGLELSVPPLSERREEAVWVFLDTLKSQLGALPSISGRFLEGLALHEWSLNFREVIQSARGLAVLHGSASRLTVAVLEEHLRPAPKERPVEPASATPYDLLLLELVRSQGNVSQAARRAGISRQHAHRLMQRFPKLKQAARNARSERE